MLARSLFCHKIHCNTHANILLYIIALRENIEYILTEFCKFRRWRTSGVSQMYYQRINITWQIPKALSSVLSAAIKADCSALLPAGPSHQQVPGTESTAPSDIDPVLGKMLTLCLLRNEQGGECPTPRGAAHVP